MESSSAHKYLKEMLSDEVFNKIKEKNPNIRRFDIMMFVNAAIRPAGESFREKAIRGEFNETGIRELDEMLYDTLGYVLLQEQIMEFLVKFCNYSQAESDTVRRAVAKKGGTEKLLPEIKERFLDYAPNRYNISMNSAMQVIDPFIQTVKDASDYGFSKNHNVPYAFTGYIAGYLRTHHPLEFCTAALNTWIGDEEKTIRLTKYMNDNNIKIKNPVFRYSRARYFFNREENTIYKGIQSIKYLNEHIGEYLYSLKDKEYNSFTELLIDLTMYANSRQIDILIKLDFFREFGKSNKLLKIKENFDKFINKKQFKKEEFKDVEDLLKEVSNKETERLFKEVDTLALCTRLESTITDESIDFSDKFKAHMEFLGSCNITDDSLGKRACIVTDIDTKYSPKISLYCMCNARTTVVKMNKRMYESLQLDVFDTIYVGIIEDRAKSKMIEGRWVKTEEMEKWLTKCEIIHKYGDY